MVTEDPNGAVDEKAKAVLAKVAEEEAELARLDRAWRRSVYLLDTARNQSARCREHLSFVPLEAGYSLADILNRLNANWKGALVLGGLLLYRAVHELLSRIVKAGKDGVELAPGNRSVLPSGGKVEQGQAPLADQGRAPSEVKAQSAKAGGK